MLLGDRLQHVLEGVGPVGGEDGVAVLEVDLVLADGDLVVAGLDVDPHVFQRLHHVLADGVGEVGGEVEIAGAVVRQRRDLVAVLLEEEELQLRAGLERVAELGQPLQLAQQDAARVAGERGRRSGCGPSR